MVNEDSRSAGSYYINVGISLGAVPDENFGDLDRQYVMKWTSLYVHHQIKCKQVRQQDTNPPYGGGVHSLGATAL